MLFTLSIISINFKFQDIFDGFWNILEWILGYNINTIFFHVVLTKQIKFCTRMRNIMVAKWLPFNGSAPEWPLYIDTLALLHVLDTLVG